MPEKKKRMTLAEKWESLTFADNYIFCKVLEDNPDVTKEILELLLDIKIDHIEQPRKENSLQVDFMSKGIRFDVYVEGDSDRCFDIEIQTSHFSNLAKRARYYQGLMDVDNLQRGEDYKVLKDSYVIFLCLGDPIGEGLPVYTFRYRADENPSILMKDGTVNIFFNVKKYDKMKSENLKTFCKYLCGQEPGTNFTDRLTALVARLKVSPQRRHEYMTWEQEIEEAKQYAREEAREEKALETAKKFLENEIDPNLVAKCTGLSLEQVLALQKEICVNA